VSPARPPAKTRPLLASGSSARRAGLRLAARSASTTETGFGRRGVAWRSASASRAVRKGDGGRRFICRHTPTVPASCLLGAGGSRMRRCARVGPRPESGFCLRSGASLPSGAPAPSVPFLVVALSETRPSEAPTSPHPARTGSDRNFKFKLSPPFRRPVVAYGVVGGWVGGWGCGFFFCFFFFFFFFSVFLLFFVSRWFCFGRSARQLLACEGPGSTSSLHVRPRFCEVEFALAGPSARLCGVQRTTSTRGRRSRRRRCRCSNCGSRLSGRWGSAPNVLSSMRSSATSGALARASRPPDVPHLSWAQIGLAGASQGAIGRSFVFAVLAVPSLACGFLMNASEQHL